MTASEKFCKAIKEALEAEYKRRISENIKRGLANKKKYRRHAN